MAIDRTASKSIRSYVAFVIAAAMLAAGCAGPNATSVSRRTPSDSRASTVAPTPKGTHTILIVLENHELGEVIGAADAPYFNRLAARGALAVDYHAVTHPSLPNYLALVSGSTFGRSEDCTDCLASGPSLATQLSAAHISWRAYMGAMPHACFDGAEAGGYAKKHNPFLYFPSVTRSAALCERDVPEPQLSRDLAGHRLPSFALISPDLCDDAHNCAFGTADEYLRGLVPKLLRHLGPEGLLAITFDEGTSDAGCCGGAAGGRVATVLLGPGVRGGARIRGAYSHYSLLATIEDRFGVPRLRHARGAPALGAAFVAG